MPAPTRVTIVAGFLGAGKTSVIRHLLSNATSSTHGSISVLVNEAGAIALDGALIGTTPSPPVNVCEVTGGCICCSAQVIFRQTVIKLLREKPQRLIIEPTGVAAVGTLRQVLSEPGIANVITLDPLILVMDPRQWQNERIRNHPLYREQCQEADVLAITHTDCCDQSLLDDFHEAHTHLPRVIADHGRLLGPATTPSVSNTSTFAPEPATTAAHNFFSDSMELPDDMPVSLDSVEAFIKGSPLPNTILRCKGALKTPAGWRAVQISADGITADSVAPQEKQHFVIIAFESTATQTWWQQFQGTLGQATQPPGTPH